MLRGRKHDRRCGVVRFRSSGIARRPSGCCIPPAPGQRCPVLTSASTERSSIRMIPAAGAMDAACGTIIFAMLRYGVGTALGLWGQLLLHPALHGQTHFFEVALEEMVSGDKDQLLGVGRAGNYLFQRIVRSKRIVIAAEEQLWLVAGL